MASIRDPAKLGPYEKVTPTNAAGDANSNDAPTIIAVTSAAASASAVRADTDIQVLIELRTITRLLTIAFNLNDDPDQLRSEEAGHLGAI